MAARWVEDGDLVAFEIEADAFMRNMNRILVGTMLQVAGGRRELDSFAGLVQGAHRRDAGPTAPPHGRPDRRDVRRLTRSASAGPCELRRRARRAIGPRRGGGPGRRALLDSAPMSADATSRATGEPMRCPSCGSRLVEVERSDVLIDACPTCRGVWLDRGELDKILVRERQMVAGDPDDDFLREVEGRPARPAPPREQPREPEYDRSPPKKRRRRSMLEDLFDFD